MLVSLNWLSDYVKIPEDLTIEDLAYDITMRTVEVERTISLKDEFSGIIVGQVLSVEKHPDADTIWVTKVDAGLDRDLQIVCGGSNLYMGQKVALAVPGARVIWHGEGEPVEIVSSELRGVLSEGMICGADEIGLGDLFPHKEAEILDLSQFPCESGMNIADALGIDDYILEIDNKSMTHRPDLWGHYGLAREIAAIYGTELKALESYEVEEHVLTYPVKIETTNCNAYSAYVFENLDLAPSPIDLKIRLWSVGIRPKNNLVDITNYVMLTTGQPTHGFDKKHVPNGIVVRDAKLNEELELLDGNVLKLDSEDVLITDGEKALALGGVMGGKKDSILEDTDSMILEIASFNALAVRRTSKRHNVRTESSSRYEKAIDTERIEDAKQLAFYLINKLLPGAKLVATGTAVQNTTKPVEVKVNYDYLNTRIGKTINRDEIHESLEPLGFVFVEETETDFTVKAPVWRSTGDIQMQADILEEIARMIGYENFDLIAPTIELKSAINQKNHSLRRNLHEYFAFRAGFQEIYTYPWVDEHYVEASSLDSSDWLELEEAPAPTQSKLRASLVPGLLESVVKNIRYREHFKLFEQGQVFVKGYETPSDYTEVLPSQFNYLGAVVVADDAMQVFREAKGVLESMSRYTHCGHISFAQVEKPTWADPQLWLNIIDENGELMGDLALISPKTAKLAGIKNRVVALFEFDLDKLVPLDSRTNSYEHLNQYQIVHQDLNILVKEEVKWTEIKEIVEPLTLSVEFVEIYRSKDLPASVKSVLLRYYLGSEEHTLSSEEIESINNEILGRLEDKLAAKIKD